MLNILLTYRRLVNNQTQLRRVARASKGKPKRLIMIAHELTASGSSLLLANLCKGYREMGYTIAILTENTAPVAPEIKEAIGESSLFRLCYRQSIRMYYLRKLRHMGFDVALGNTTLSGCFAASLREAGIHSVFLIHEMTASLHILHLQQTARDIIQYGEALVFPAHQVKDAFLRFAGIQCEESKIHILAQGCRLLPDHMVSKAQATKALRQKLGLEQNAKILVGAGAINFGKGVDFCLLILQKLLASHPGAPYHLIWLGAVQEADPYMLWLKVQIDACGLSEYVHFLGFQDDPNAYFETLNGSDVFLLCSREDSFPSVMIEALCLQLPVLAFSEGGGGAEYLSANRMGVCVPMGDIDAACGVVKDMCARPECYASPETKLRAQKDFAFERYAGRLLSLVNTNQRSEG